jgi:hypothetical protein
MNKDFLKIGQQAVKEYYPDASVALLAGSWLRGEATATSDVDIVVLYDETFQSPHRKSVTFQDTPIEFFVHNPSANGYFLHQDWDSGTSILINMMLQGVVFPEITPLATQRIAIAQKIYHAGPRPLTHDEIDMRRYFIGDLMDDLAEPRNEIERQFMLGLWFQKIADFYLLANNRWSGTGKHLPRILHASGLEKSKDILQIYLSNIGDPDYQAIKACTLSVLSSFGGKLWHNYSANAKVDANTFDETAWLKKLSGQSNGTGYTPT